jgi:N-acetylneuraminate synthase
MARRLIEVAAKAGADAVKFQTFKVEALYSPHAGTIDPERIGGSIFDALSKLAVPLDWLPILSDDALRCGLVFLSSVFDEEGVDELDPFVLAHKVASYEITHLPLLRRVAASRKPVILSTATATLDEVREAVETLREAGATELVLLQCTAAYPAPLDSLNLRAIVTLRETFNVPSGLSDHSRDPVAAPVAAVALGASVIEKHFTLGNQLPGPDHEFALEPAELMRMVRAIRDTEAGLGSGIKIGHPVEAKRAAFGRRCLFARVDIPVGERLSHANLIVLRCGELKPGLHPRYYEAVIGLRARRLVSAGMPVGDADVDGDFV